MRVISPPKHPHQGGDVNSLHRAQRKDSIFGGVKNFFTVFGHFTQKALQNVGKTYLGHVLINRSHQMNNHFLPPVVTMCQLNREMFRKCDMPGNLGDLGPLPLGIQVLQAVWCGVLMYLSTTREYLEYLSTPVLSLTLDTKVQLIKEHCRSKIAKVPKLDGCWELASTLSVSQILKNVHRSLQPEFIWDTKDTGHFKSIDLMFRHHICSSCLANTSRSV